ncbi:MAG TPA: hypothetical protein P5290_08230 [Candidatus Methanomethylicus sp.]|nr:hypothetical protein [Candidatus Methanomethylicus sp.]
MGTPKLTKQAILEGTRVRSTITVKEYGAEVVIRPLTDGELTKIFGVVGAIPLKADGTPDVAGMDVSKNFEALRLAASMGMEEPKLTVDEVASMKFGVPEYVGMKVLELSGVSGEGASQKKRR